MCGFRCNVACQVAERDFRVALGRARKAGQRTSIAATRQVVSVYFNLLGKIGYAAQTPLPVRNFSAWAMSAHNGRPTFAASRRPVSGICPLLPILRQPIKLGLSSPA
jgi:hypothetical protein